MASPPDSISVLQFLVKTLRAKKVVEVGVFTGYMTLGIALALPQDGKTIACDINDDFVSVGKPYWKKAGVESKIDLRIGPAQATLDALLEDGQEGTFDLGFIDADKSAYDGYYESLLRLLRPGGIIAIDNVLWGGRVLHPAKPDDVDTQALQALNKKVFQDERVEICMLTNSDGITLALKR